MQAPLEGLTGQSNESMAANMRLLILQSQRMLHTTLLTLTWDALSSEDVVEGKFGDKHTLKLMADAWSFRPCRRESGSHRLLVLVTVLKRCDLMSLFNARDSDEGERRSDGGTVSSITGIIDLRCAATKGIYRWHGPCAKESG